MSIVTVITPDALQGNGEITKPGTVMWWNDYQRHYLAEGDSWFSLSDILSPSLLYRFGFNVPLRQSTLIVNCSYPGDTLQHMVDWSANPTFLQLLHSKSSGWEWDGILLSGGGNDIIDAALSPAGILRSCASPNDPEDFVSQGDIVVLAQHLQECFRHIVNLRNTSEIPENRSIPIFFHTYGYPTPRNAPASFGIGPWLYEAFMRKAIPEQFWNDLSDHLMNELAIMLRGFSNLGANLNVVDTLRNVQLERAAKGSNGSSGDWLNEIHLNNAGKDKVAREWAKFL